MIDMARLKELAWTLRELTHEEHEELVTLWNARREYLIECFVSIALAK